MSYTITRRLDSAFHALGAEFDALYCDRDFFRVLEDLRASTGGYWHQNAGILLAMLRQCGLSCPRAAAYDTAHYESAIRELIAAGKILRAEELSDKVMSICARLARQYAEYPAPREYMQRLVDRLSRPDDPWQQDSLRLRILKQFIKYGNYASALLPKGSAQKKIKTYVAEKLGLASVKENDILTHLDDGIFRQMKDCDLLLMCDALAAGRFRTNGATKRDLYLFAIVFDMTYFSNTRKGAVYDEARDIDKNLFRDYYATNVLQFLSDAYQNAKQDGLLDPSDCSINYKNFAEMICLYYLCQDLPARDKFRKIRQMLDTVKITAKGEAAPATPDRETGATLQLKSRIYGEATPAGLIASEDIMAMGEADFQEFLLENYDRRCYRGKQDISPFEVNADGRTAAAEFARIAERLISQPGDADSFRYGLFFDEVRTGASAQLPPEEADFLQLLRWVDQLLRDWLADGTNPQRVNRTRLLCAYYYAYNLDHMDDDYSGDGLRYHGRSFHEHYEAFRLGADALFAKANFAPLSSKSLLDLLIVFSSFIYINA